MDSASPPAVEVTLSPLSSDDKGDSTSQQAECMICYEEPTTYGLLDACAHVFCISCIEQWQTKLEEDAQGPVNGNMLKARDSCPVCREPYKILFPSPELFPVKKDRLEALNSYKEMLSKLPCEDLLNSPASRRYCPRGIDCLYSHTLSLPNPASSSTDKTTTYTYTFTHTFHSHLLLESRLRSERVAQRILRTLISFAYQPNPTLNDYAAYAQAVSEEFDRVHATLTREEREDPLVWAIVEDVQEGASSDPTGEIIYHRLAQLGREPWQLQRGSLTINGEEEDDWVEDEGEGNGESGSEVESEEASQEGSSEEEAFPRSRRSRAPSLPEIEDIDRDEDEPPAQLHDWLGGSGEGDSRRWNRAIAVEGSSVDDDEQDRLDRLAERYLNQRLGRYDGSDEENSGEGDEEESEGEEEASEENSGSDGGYTTDRVRRMAEIVERVEANPLRRPRHPRTRATAAPSTSSWNPYTPPAPRTSATPSFRSLPPSNSLSTFRPGLQGHLSMFDHARDIRGTPAVPNVSSDQEDTVQTFPTTLRSLLSHLCRRTGYEPQPEDTIDELGSIAFESPDKPLEAFVSDLSDFDRRIIERIRVQFSAFIACDVPPGTELAVQQDMMRTFGYEESPVMLEVCLIMNEASDEVQQEWERYVEGVKGRQYVYDAQEGFSEEEEAEEPRFDQIMDNRPYEVREAEAISQAMHARYQLPDLTPRRPSTPPAAEEEEEEEEEPEAQWESHGHFISPDGQPYTVSRADAIAFLIAQGQEEEEEEEQEADQESDESESHSEIMRRIRQNFDLPSLDSLGHGRAEEVDDDEEEDVDQDSDDSTTPSEIMRRIRRNYYLPDLDSVGRVSEQRSTRARQEEEDEEEDSADVEDQEFINEYMRQYSRAEQRPNPSSPSINPYVASGEIDDEIPPPQHPYRTNHFGSDPQELRRQIERERESLRDFYDELD